MSVAPPAADTPRVIATACMSRVSRRTVSASCQIGALAAIAPSITWRPKARQDTSFWGVWEEGRVTPRQITSTHSN